MAQDLVLRNFSPGHPLASPSRGGYALRLMTDVTRLLNALEKGDPPEASRLLPLGYEELRRLAVQRIAWPRPDIV
jgi:hypothetical protein